jgi:site-specific recombinase XerD
VLDKYALQAGIEPVNPHALRHTFATRYLNANPGDLRGLARLLGHTGLDTVMIITMGTGCQERVCAEAARIDLKVSVAEATPKALISQR